MTKACQLDVGIAERPRNYRVFIQVRTKAGNVFKRNNKLNVCYLGLQNIKSHDIETMRISCSLNLMSF